MNFPSCTGFIFDLDGTLVDTLPGIETSARAAVQAVMPGAQLPPLAPLIGPPLVGMFRVALPAATPEQLEALAAAFRKHYDSEGWRNSLPYPGISEVLGELNRRAVFCCVATNKRRIPALQIVDHLGWHRVMRETLTFDMRQPPFPEKGEMVRLLLERYSLEPARTVMVGDATNDQDAARANRMPFAWASWGYGKVAEPSLTLAQPADILTLSR